MTKIKKLMIGVLALLFLLGGYYLYCIHSIEYFSTYDSYRQKIQGDTYNSALSSKYFKQKCQQTGGEIIKEAKCESSIGSLQEAWCKDINVYCHCPFIMTWDNEKGCKFL